MKILNTYPVDDQFYMPGEFEAHSGCWLLWPERGDIWPNNALPAQNLLLKLANTICQYENVTLGVSAKNYKDVKKRVCQNVRVVEISYNDIWIRDFGAIFLTNPSKSQLRGVSWNFNAWGGENEGLYFPWDLDNQLSSKMCDLDNIDFYQSNLILEGGSICVDGCGTLITTEECLLNENRNPNKTKDEIEKYLRRYFNVQTVIWLPNGMDEDETGGHVDNICCFTAPNEVLLTWTDDKSDPQWEVSRNAYKELIKHKDKSNNQLKINKIVHPPLISITEEECNLYSEGYKTIKRRAGDKLPASYINFYQNDNAIFFPLFGVETDELALNQIKLIVPQKEIITFQTRDFLLGGGNIHCITQQIPKI